MPLNPRLDQHLSNLVLRVVSNEEFMTSSGEELHKSTILKLQKSVSCCGIVAICINDQLPMQDNVNLIKIHAY